MKVCDKCKKELSLDFAQVPDPYFSIYKFKDGFNISVDLCPSCCKTLDAWLKGNLFICTHTEKNWTDKCSYKKEC